MCNQTIHWLWFMTYKLRLGNTRTPTTQRRTASYLLQLIPFSSHHKVTSLDAATLFGVKGLVAAITGGGSDKLNIILNLSFTCRWLYRNWSYASPFSQSKRRNSLYHRSLFRDQEAVSGAAISDQEEFTASITHYWW